MIFYPRVHIGSVHIGASAFDVAPPRSPSSPLTTRASEEHLDLGVEWPMFVHNVTS